jgi:hypothetical protein
LKSDLANNWRKRQAGRVKFTLAALFAIVALVAFAAASAWLLGAARLAYRPWVVSAGAALLLLLAVALSCGCVACLQLYKKRFALLIRIAGTAALLGLAGFLVFWGGFLILFTSVEEQAVERDGTVMLAEVNAFLDVSVDYYEYENWFVCGKTRRIHEWYGDGGYNPFDRDPMPEPKTATYYDKAGNRVAD